MADLVNCFVYGTLRVGQYNYKLIEPAVYESYRDVVAIGSLYFVSPGSYPVAKFDEEGQIFGDILVCDSEAFAFQRAYQMEIGAGYSFIKIDVPKFKVPIYGFHFDFAVNPALRIPGGNWIKAAEEYDA